MEDHTPGDVLEEELQSPRSPVQSSYGGSDAGDNDVGDLETLNAGEDEDGETDQEEHPDAELDDMEQDEGHALANEEDNEDQSEREDGQQEEANERESDRERLNTAAPPLPSIENTVPAAVAGQSGSQATSNGPAEDKPRYKYKYPEAYPTPPGWEDEKWNKAYTAADSRIYNHAKKDHKVSRQKRLEGVTRQEALIWEEQRAEREARKASKSTPTSKQQNSRAAASSSIPSASAQIPSSDAEMANKKNQKKKKKAPAAMPVASSSSQPPNLSTTAFPEDLAAFGSIQTLADRVKGKSAASAAASSVPVDAGTPLRAESEKAPQVKKGGIGSVKKQPMTNGHLHTPPAGKAQSVSKVSASKPRGSNSGTPASVPSNLQLGSLEQFSDDEADGDEMATYCVCNGPESTYMISCDSCEGWFHRRVTCLGEGDVALFKELADHIDHWYCPPCRKKDPSLAVTWYRSCRRQLCNKRALVDSDPPSKYCSEECAVKFFQEKIAQASQSTEPSRGGPLTQSEISLALNATNSASEFKKLGKTAPKLRAQGKVVSKQFLRNMVSASSSNANGGGESAGKVFENKAEYEDHREKEAGDANERRGIALAQQQQYERYNQVHEGPPLSEDELRFGLDAALGPAGGITNENYMEIDWEFLQKHGAINPSEAQTIDELQQLMKFDANWIGITSLKGSYIEAVHKHAAEILESKGLDFKTACGFLPQISMSDNEFRKWVETQEGMKICDTGKYEPLDPRDSEAWRKKSEAAICMHSSKKHATHNGWFTVHKRDNTTRMAQLTHEFHSKLKELQEIMTMVETRIYGGE